MIQDKIISKDVVRRNKQEEKSYVFVRSASEFLGGDYFIKHLLILYIYLNPLLNDDKRKHSQIYFRRVLIGLNTGTVAAVGDASQTAKMIFVF